MKTDIHRGKIIWGYRDDAMGRWKIQVLHLQTKECPRWPSKHWKLGRVKKELPYQFQRKCCLADTSILDLSFPEWCDYTLLLSWAIQKYFYMFVVLCYSSHRKLKQWCPSCLPLAAAAMNVLTHTASHILIAVGWMQFVNHSMCTWYLLACVWVLLGWHNKIP